MLRIATDNPVESQLREDATALMRAALDAADPRKAIWHVLSLEEDALRVGDRAYRLGQRDRLVVVGAGKASATMSQAVEETLGERIHEDGSRMVVYGLQLRPGNSDLVISDVCVKDYKSI
jgi:hydroxypyruvate reductase